MCMFQSITFSSRLSWLNGSREAASHLRWLVMGLSPRLLSIVKAAQGFLKSAFLLWSKVKIKAVHLIEDNRANIWRHRKILTVKLTSHDKASMASRIKMTANFAFFAVLKKLVLVSVKKLAKSSSMDLMTKENYSKVSSDDSEDGRSATFEIDIERSKDLSSLSDEKAPRNVFIRRPAMNQVRSPDINHWPYLCQAGPVWPGGLKSPLLDKCEEKS